MASIANAFDNGYDAIRLSNDTAVPTLPPQSIWAFRDPNQLRSRFARFDPRNIDSADLLAGIGGLTAGGLGLGMSIPEPPRRDER